MKLINDTPDIIRLQNNTGTLTIESLYVKANGVSGFKYALMGLETIIGIVAESGIAPGEVCPIHKWPVAAYATISPFETDPLSLHLDQTVPQTISGGAPEFSGGIFVSGDYLSDINFSNRIGTGAGAVNTGWANIFIGYTAGTINNGGNYNTAVGYRTLTSNITGHQNTCIGYMAGWQNTADNNSFLGYLAGYSNTSGVNNTFLGCQAGESNSVGTNSVFVGYQAGYYETGNNKLFIDNVKRASEAEARTKALIYGVFDAIVANQSLTLNIGNLYLGSADITTTGTVTGINITSGVDPGHTHTAGSITEADPVFGAWLAGPPNISEFTNDLGYLTAEVDTLASVTGRGSVTADDITVNSVDITSGEAYKINTVPIIKYANTGTYLFGNTGYTGTGNHNFLCGNGAGGALTTGYNNILMGAEAGDALQGGYGHIAIGYQALSAMIGGYQHIAIGYTALKALTGTGQTIGIGYAAGTKLTASNYNTLVGVYALPAAIINSSGNVCIGYTTMYNALSSENNTCIGTSAGRYLNAGASCTEMDNCVLIGNDTRTLANADTNEIVIGAAARGSGSNTVTIETAQSLITILQETCVSAIPVFANNAAAIAGGLTAGTFYRTNADPDPVCVVH